MFEIEEKLWLSDAMKKYEKKFSNNVLNIINSPAGSGKTTFIFEDLLLNYKNYGIDELRLNKIIYVCDTNSLATRIVNTKQDLTQEYKYGILDNLTYDNVIGTKNRIIVMTYSMLGTLIKSDNNLNKILMADTIIFDEIHQVPIYSYKFDTKVSDKKREGVYKNILECIPEMAKKCYCIGLSATIHENIIYRLEQDHIKTNNIFKTREVNNIKSYNFEPKYINFAFNVVKEYALRKNIFEDGEKLIIYTNTIKRAEEYKQHLIKFGIKAEWICSDNAVKEDENGEKVKRMNSYQYDLRQELLDTGYIYKDIQCLIINAAYETGIDIENKEYQHVIIDNSNEITQTQARNRIRNNIKELYVLLSKSIIGYDEEYKCHYKINRTGKYGEYLEQGEYLYNTNLTKYIDDKYVNVKLTKELKNEMVEKYATKEVGKEKREFTFKSLENSINETNMSFRMYKDRNKGTWLFKRSDIISFLKNNNKKYSSQTLEDYFKFINKKNSNDTEIITYLEDISNQRLYKDDKNNLAKVINCKKNGKLQTGIDSINNKLKEFKFEIIGETDWKRSLPNGDKNKKYGTKFYMIKQTI